MRTMPTFRDIGTFRPKPQLPRLWRQLQKMREEVRTGVPKDVARAVIEIAKRKNPAAPDPQKTQTYPSDFPSQARVFVPEDCLDGVPLGCLGGKFGWISKWENYKKWLRAPDLRKEWSREDLWDLWTKACEWPDMGIDAKIVLACP
eukprot:gene17793-biopygen28129